MNDTLDRRFFAALFFAALLLGPDSALFAQPVLLRSVPATEESVPAPPKLMLTFNGRVVVHLSSVLLVGGPRNTRVLLSSPQAPDADTLVYPLPTLSPGQYQAQWKTHGLDGKVMEGTLRFTVIEVSR